MIKYSYDILLKLSVAWQCTMFRNLFSLHYCCKHFVNSLSPCYSFYSHYFSSDHLVSLWHEIVSWPWIIADVCLLELMRHCGRCHCHVKKCSPIRPGAKVMRKLSHRLFIWFNIFTGRNGFYRQGNNKFKGFFDHKNNQDVCSMVHLAWNFV